MMFTDGIERNVLDHHHLVVPRLEGGGEVAVGAVLNAAEDLLEHLGDALGRALQPVPVGVLADRLEDLADGLLDAPPVELRHAGLGRGLGTVRATRLRAWVRGWAAAGRGTWAGLLPASPRISMTSGVSSVSFSTRAWAR